MVTHKRPIFFISSENIKPSTFQWCKISMVRDKFLSFKDLFLIFSCSKAIMYLNFLLCSLLAITFD